MDKASDLEKRYGIPGRVSIMEGQGGLPMVRVDSDFSAAEIYLHGAHVTHFQKKSEPPILWMSAESKFDERSAIRGGVPVILPWFGARAGQTAAHGFARVKNWELKEMAMSANGSVRVRLRLPEFSEYAGFVPFTADYVVTVGERLELELAVNNSSSDELVFEECLHSYFTVGDINAVSLAGLKGVKYVDKVDGGKEKTEMNEAISITSEVDRVYMDTTAAVEIRDAKLRRKIRVEKENSASTVVWNPWVAKSKAMADFGDEEYHTMVCVESGNVGKNSVTLPAGKTAVMKVRVMSGQ
jgi:glucose-6-phosphate 1-epimerase